MDTLHTPVIMIAGKTINPGWDKTGTTPLDGITIVWGTDSHYEEVPPATLKLKLIVTPGDFQATSFQGREVTIDTDLGRLYRGWVTDTEWEEIYLWDEVTGNTRYWLVYLVAQDPSAPIRAMIPTARRYDLTRATTESDKAFWRWNDNYLFEQRQAPYFGSSNEFGRSADAARLSTAEQIVESGIVTRVKPWSPPSSPNTGVRVHDDSADAWQLLREGYGIVPLAEPAYDPRDDSIHYTVPVSAVPGVQLSYSGGKLTLSAQSGTPARILPGDVMIVPNGAIQMSTDRVLVISRVEYQSDLAAVVIGKIILPNHTAFKDAFYRSMSRETNEKAVPGAGSEGGVYRRNINMRRTLGKEGTWDVTSPETKFDANNGTSLDTHFANTVNLVAKLNRRVAPPELAFDWERHANLVPTATERALLAVTPLAFQATPFVLTGSAVLEEIGIEPYGQVIGGTLTFEQGWRHALRFAPIVTAPAPNLTLSQVVTNSTARYIDFDESITYSDYGLITQGAT